MDTWMAVLPFMIAVALLFAILWRKPNAMRLPDHKLSDLLPSDTATPWKHSYACTECHSPVGHQEFMTKICLTCGQRMRWLPHSSAFRYVVRNGAWVRHQGGSVNLLELSTGRWVSPDTYDARTVSAQKQPTPTATEREQKASGGGTDAI